MEDAKAILDRYAGIVVEKSAIWQRDGQDSVDQTKNRHYANGGYSEDIILWYAPKDCLRIEFEDEPKQNEFWIAECEAACKSLGWDYCITAHGGKSPYINVFNIKGMPVNEDNKLARLLMAEMILPSGAKNKLDRTNLGWTLTPVIGHPHWKKKYNGAIHKIVIGKNPLDHVNEYPKELLKKIKDSKKRIDRAINAVKEDAAWVDDFLLNYCCSQELPKGSRHTVIVKNLSAHIIHRQDRELIEETFCRVQNMSCSEFKGWYTSILNGNYTEVNAGELFNYIKDNSVPYVVKANNKKDVAGEEVLFKIDNHQHNVEMFYMKQPFFFDNSRIFWFWNKNKYCYEILDETDVMRMLDRQLGLFGQTVGTNMKANYLEAFRRVGRDHIPKEAPKKWIQFKNKAFSLESGETYDVQPNYFFTNPIPWDIGENSNTPVMDKLFVDWVGEDRKQQLYELLAYCCYSGYPIQLLFCLWGNGRNGKSQYMKIMSKFIGTGNSTTTELDVLTGNRFESFKLYKKLLCTIGETNFGMLQSSSLIKRLVGGDMIGFEKKNKDPFSDYNYAKIIIASNSLPSSQDTSDGFYRRWMIIGFENEFEEAGYEVFEDIPDDEYRALAKKVCEMLPTLLENGKFTGQGTINERKEKYISVSNPLSQFLDEQCERSVTNYVEYNKLYNAYVQYLLSRKRRKVSMKEFKSALEDEGLYGTRTTKPIRVEDSKGNISTDYRLQIWIDGIDLKQNLSHLTDLQQISTQPIRVCKDVESSEKVLNVINEEWVHTSMAIIHLPCNVCKQEPSHWYQVNGKPVCDGCKSTYNIKVQS